MPRPIEMHAHDAKRYLGDMLAWVHQSLASEKDLLTSLFGSEDTQTISVIESSGGPEEIALSPRENVGLEMPRTGMLLDRIFESICRPLQVSLIPSFWCITEE